jgi:hypothetical protein
MPGGDDGGSDASRGITFGRRGGGNSEETGRPLGKKRWGRSSARAGIGLERKLEIHVTADRLLVGPNDLMIPVGQGEKPEELLQRVLGAIEHMAQSWGAPPANFYWLPAIKFTVFSGGNVHYERLRGPLAKWGISSTVEYSLDTRAANGREGGPR